MTTESEYEGLAIVKVPDGTSVPDAFNSSTDIVNVPSTESPGAGLGSKPAPESV